VFVALLMIAASASACSSPQTLYAQRTIAEAPLPSITVVQGDAIVVDGQHVRLADIAAPQPAPLARCVAEVAAARQTRLRLVALTQGVHDVTVTPTGEVDEFGRIKAHILFDGQDPTAVLIDEGLALAAGPERTDWCVSFSEARPEAMHIARLSMLGR